MDYRTANNPEPFSTYGKESPEETIRRLEQELAEARALLKAIDDEVAPDDYGDLCAFFTDDMLARLKLFLARYEEEDDPPF